jgi:hypothetical protein
MIKSTFIGGLVMGLFAICATALAQEAVPEVEPEPGAPVPAPAPLPSGAAIELGLRIGFGYPVGNEGAVAGSNNTSLHDDISGMIPIWIDAGFRANPNVYVGVFFQYAFAFVNNNQNPDCAQSGVSCSAKDLRLGLDAHYHFSPGESLDPWVGVGAGYEWLALDESSGALSVSETASGFEFVNLQLGGDFSVAPNFGVGPFFAFTLAEYSHVGGTIDTDLATKSIHGWMMGGVRGVFDIGL